MKFWIVKNEDLVRYENPEYPRDAMFCICEDGLVYLNNHINNNFINRYFIFDLPILINQAKNVLVFSGNNISFNKTKTAQSLLENETIKKTVYKYILTAKRLAIKDLQNILQIDRDIARTIMDELTNNDIVEKYYSWFRLTGYGKSLLNDFYIANLNKNEVINI